MFSVPKFSTRIYNKQQCSVKHNIHLINVFMDYMFRFARNHHQALSKNTQIHYIKLLKRVLGSQTFTINVWLRYMCLC